jgi:hypothetical protein
MRDAWERRWALSAVLVGIATGALLWFVASPDSSLRAGNGSALYTATITAAAALAALGIVPISIVLGLNSPRVRRLGRLKGHELRRSVAMAVGWHLATIVVSVVLLALDSENDPIRLGRVGAVVVLVLGVEATSRAVIEFLAMLRLDNETGDVVGPQPRLSEDFASRMTDSPRPIDLEGDDG